MYGCKFGIANPGSIQPVKFHLIDEKKPKLWQSQPKIGNGARSRRNHQGAERQITREQGAKRNENCQKGARGKSQKGAGRVR